MNKVSGVLLVVVVSTSLLFLFGCASDQAGITQSHVQTANVSSPETSDGFNYPIRSYFPVKNGFLEKNVRTVGCPLSYHPGEDVGDSSKTPVYAASNGRVVFADYQDEFSGYIVVIEHVCPPGIRFKLPDASQTDKVWSAYYHMAAIDEANVSLDKIVTRGTRIGFMGDFPHGSGKRYHLHFEIRKVNLWNGSAYISAGRREYGLCNKPKEWVAERFVCPSAFIKLNRPR